ncbi:hypothetical protein DC498_12650 [Terrimonas sp.]|uniref:hypothetical protein n=1 Tax=Terrimonas sp. TaxID=1914338 RepID=UPI000D513FD7|nr:hypothetical protein [Terrimonas sp.]PVD51891.1 hypothetical protein DC498_12650 [Terrimonas sp.]
MTRKKLKQKIYEEEDYTWSKKELMHKRLGKERKTIAGLLLLVAESFIPEHIQKHIKAFSKN